MNSRSGCTNFIPRPVQDPLFTLGINWCIELMYSLIPRLSPLRRVINAQVRRLRSGKSLGTRLGLLLVHVSNDSVYHVVVNDGVYA